jgi:hypothetical protein
MKHLTNYYKNLCENLKKEIESLEKELELAESSHKGGKKKVKKQSEPAKEEPKKDVTAGMSPLIADFVRTMQQAYGNRG